MILNKCKYCFRSALNNIRRNTILSLLSVSTIAVTFIVFISFLLVLMNVSAFKKNWTERMRIIVFFDPAATVAAVEKSCSVIETMPEIATSEFISPDAALRFLKASLKGQDGLLEGLTGNPLPSSIELKLKPGHAGPRTGAFKDFIARLQNNDTVKDVEYGQKWLERFKVLGDTLTYIGICLGGLLFLFTLFIISNTIRLMIYIRRDEIEIMRLVGATNLFITTPFCFEGIIQGLFGAAAALVVFIASQHLLLDKTAAFLESYIGPQTLIGIHFSFSVYMLFLGAVLGLAGSLLAIGSLEELQR